MNEYIIKCDACNDWNILDEDSIGLKGPICHKCGDLLDLKNGQWASTYSLTQKPTVEGYRVCALHFAYAPWVKWEDDILNKRTNSPSKGMFYNEVLALEYDEGTAPITLQQLQECCDPNMVMSTEPTAIDKSYTGIMGIDYGPQSSENSSTVCAVVQNRAGKLYVPFLKKFKGKEANFHFIHNEIPKLMSTWQCQILAADYGMGEASNSEIRSRIGDTKVIAFQHMRDQKEIVRWNSKMPAYTLARTQIMTIVFQMIKNKEIVFPAWEYFEPYANDILNIQMETDELLGKTKYIHIGPDDSFHAILYAVVANRLMTGIEF